MSTLAVVEEIMRETGVPMSVKEIVDQAGPRLPSRSKTPDTVVARDLSMDIKRQGDASMFVRTAPGRYTLRSLHQAAMANPQANVQPSAAPSVPSSAAPTSATEVALRGQERAPMRSAPRASSSADETSSQNSVG